MSTYLRFTNHCTFERRETDGIVQGMNTIQPFIQNEAGQTVPNPAYITAGGDNYEDVTKVPCLFLYLATDEVTSPAAEWEDVIEVVVGDTLEPKYTDRIKNISDRYGKIIEVGPLEIIGIKRYVGFQGKLHHYRIRTRRMKDC